MVERIIREIPARQAPHDEPGGRREKMVAGDGANFEICSARASYSPLIRLQMVASHLNVPTL